MTADSDPLCTAPRILIDIDAFHGPPHRRTEFRVVRAIPLGSRHQDGRLPPMMPTRNAEVANTCVAASGPPLVSIFTTVNPAKLPKVL